MGTEPGLLFILSHHGENSGVNLLSYSTPNLKASTFYLLLDYLSNVF